MTRAAAIRLTFVACSLIVVATTDARGATAPQQVPTSGVDTVRPSRVSADTALEALTRSVAAQLRCPVCQGLSLADSPSELALEMKDVVRQQLAAGRTPDEVKAYFVAKYGEWILLEPPRRGINLLAYALPAVAIVAGLGVIWLALRRWTSVPTSAEEVPAPNAVD
jgi:cytochrome c-type biogenesis protein CcmH/NrfF